jgi:hypothetical protein
MTTYRQSFYKVMAVILEFFRVAKQAIRSIICPSIDADLTKKLDTKLLSLSHRLQTGGLSSNYTISVLIQVHSCLIGSVKSSVFAGARMGLFVCSTCRIYLSRKRTMKFMMHLSSQPRMQFFKQILLLLASI